MRTIVLSVFAMICGLSVSAQGSLKETSDNLHMFNHLDASVTLGTTGIGFDVATPVGNYVQLRAGYSFMPSFHKSMFFNVQVGEKPENKYDANGNRVVTKLDKMTDVLRQMTGYQVDDQVEMIGVPTYNNLKVLVDVFPFKQDKRWHVTAGFFLGPSKIAKSYNATEAMPTLMAVSIYNTMRDKTLASYDSYMSGETFVPEPIFSYQFSNGFIYEIGGPRLIESLAARFNNYGRMGMHVGDYDDGTPYLMEPGNDGMVRANVKVNAFKPYLGAGYGGRLLKNNDKFHIAVDLGAMFWGGSPHIVTHDGTNLTRDVDNISGKVGSYVRLAKQFQVFPVLDVRLIYSVF
ncbi:MAG: hypothetical protein IKY01_07335 [Prevotella sp.]|nr:hypothetical protein [Prevotella sp.]MBR5748584.1 hypothetical protein [Prevotella sp.]